MVAYSAILAISAFAPVTSGRIGVRRIFDPARSWPHGSGSTFVADVVTDGPSARAGLRTGDILRFDRMDVNSLLAFKTPIVGQSLTIAFERDGKRGEAIVVPTVFRPFNFTTIFASGVAFIYLCLALLVAWRGPPRIESRLIVLFLIALAMVGPLAILRSIMPSVFAAQVVEAARDAAVMLLFFCQFLFPAVFPPRDTRAPRWIMRIGVPLTIVSALLFTARDYGNVLYAFAAILNPISEVLGLAFEAVVIVAVIEGIRSTSAAFRAQAISAGSTLVALSLAFAYWYTTVFWNGGKPPPDFVSAVQFTAGLGMTYAVLRHRLLDIGVILSRAAIFSIVSIVLVVAFAIAEWALAYVIEHAVGSRFEGETKLGIAVATALAVGLSARWVHERLSHRLNRIFFAKRYRALRDVHRFMLETDSATDPAALLDLTIVMLGRHTEAAYIALYIGDPNSGYSALQTGPPTASAHMRPNDELVLRLRRWGEAFVDDVVGSEFERALICPMTLRGTLLGYVVCGPKRDGSSYLEDERNALTSLVHRVGIAHEWLNRPSAGLTLPALAVGP